MRWTLTLFAYLLVGWLGARAAEIEGVLAAAEVPQRDPAHDVGSVDGTPAGARIPGRHMEVGW